MSRAPEIHFDSIVVDAHADTIGRVLDRGEEITKRTASGQIDLVRMEEGGLDAQFFSCWVEPKYVERGESARRALRMIDAVKQVAAGSGGRLQIARTAGEIRSIVKAGRKAAVLCIEGGYAIEDDLGLLRTFHELGVRYMTLTWNQSTNWADACGGPFRHNGLSPFGREVVREMNRLGMMVDLSHVSEKTFFDAVATASKPVICSHSSAKALCGHRRNLTDEQLRAVARNGGVACVNFYSAFLSEEFRLFSARLDEEKDRELSAARARGDSEAELSRIKEEFNRRESDHPRPALEVLLRHIEHMVGVAGIDHVGIGSDFDGSESVPEGMEDCSKLPRLTEALLKRGMPEAGVRKILGENTLRVLEANAG